MRSPRTAAAITVIFTTVAGAVISEAPSSQAEPRGTSLERLKEAYPKLKADRVDRDRLPVATRHELELGPEAAFRPDTKGGRLVLAKGGKRMFLVPAPEHACLAIVADDATSRQIACAGTDEITARPLVGAGSDRNGFVVQGVAPAGTGNYRIRTAAGETLAVDTSTGGFMQHVTDIPTMLIYADATGGDTATALVVPAPPG